MGMHTHSGYLDSPHFGAVALHTVFVGLRRQCAMVYLQIDSPSSDQRVCEQRVQIP